MTIVISSCSWGAGEWSMNSDSSLYQISHPGVTQYLFEAGHDVVNLSVPGGDPMGMLWSLSAFMECNKHKTLDIYVIQTDIGRSMPWSNMLQDDSVSLVDAVDRLYYEYYQSLDQSAKKNNLKIKLIGGLTDITTDLSALTNLEILSPSWCQMIDPSIPLIKLVDQVGITFLENTYKNRKSEILRFVEESLDRQAFWNSHPDMFHPDGIHPNRQMHRLLSDFILEKLQ